MEDEEDSESALDGMSSYLGGNSMPDIISGEPPEQIIVCYEDGSESDFRTLLEFLKNKIDRPASQVMIEALVIEINSEDYNSNLYNQISYAEAMSTLHGILENGEN